MFQIFAETLPTSGFDWFIELTRGLGVPGAFLAIVAYTGKKFFTWITPWAEKLFLAHIDRQRSMSESQKKLVDTLIDMEQKNANRLDRIESNINTSCKFLANNPNLLLPPR